MLPLFTPSSPPLGQSLYVFLPVSFLFRCFLPILQFVIGVWEFLVQWMFIFGICMPRVRVSFSPLRICLLLFSSTAFGHHIRYRFVVGIAIALLKASLCFVLHEFYSLIYYALAGNRSFLFCSCSQLLLLLLLLFSSDLINNLKFGIWSCLFRVKSNFKKHLQKFIRGKTSLFWSDIEIFVQLFIANQKSRNKCDTIKEYTDQLNGKLSS